MFYLRKYERAITYLIILILFILMFFFSGCCRPAFKSVIFTQIDTIYINPDIDTIRIEKEYKIKKDSIVFDTIKIENEFSKVTIFPVHGKIKAELISKPFQIEIKASKKQEITQYKTITNKKLIGYCIMSFFAGIFITGFAMLIIYIKEKYGRS